MENSGGTTIKLVVVRKTRNCWKIIVEVFLFLDEPDQLLERWAVDQNNCEFGFSLAYYPKARILPKKQRKRGRG